jgi:SOS response regulatory protein OraA/RecX
MDDASRGAAEGERLAPVTPLRRGAAAADHGRDEHPSRRSGTRPVVGLGDGGWNNTWGSEPSAPSAAAASSGSGSASVADDEDEETARQTRKTTGLAIRQLARRGMSRWELEQLLTKREIDPEVFGPELDRLESLGVIDDASLATSLAFTQHSRKGLGRTAIEQELKRRHIDPELIESALADIGDDDELERATELAVKRIGQLAAYDDETVRRRLHGFLARKGYSSDVVRRAMEAAFAGRRSRGGSGVRFQ